MCLHRLPVPLSEFPSQQFPELDQPGLARLSANLIFTVRFQYYEFYGVSYAERAFFQLLLQ
jgi:hypothetical protein